MEAEEPDALNRLGRRAYEQGDLALAIALQTTALRHAPDHADALRDLAHARAAVASSPDAERAYASALALEPGIARHHGSVGAQLPVAGIVRVEGLIRDALAADPGHARAHAAFGNIAARRGRRPEAMASYARAVMLDWTFAEAHLALAQLYDTAGNTLDGERHLAAALALRTHYVAHAPYAVRRVLVLKAAGGFLASGLLDFCIDTERTDLDVCYVTDATAALPDLTPYDAIFHAVAAAESRAATIARCAQLLAGSERPVINDPRRSAPVQRDALAATLAGIAGCVVPRTLRCARADVAGAIVPPVLIRPIDTHRGDGLERLDDPCDVAAYLERVPAAAYHLTPFVDYRSPDGWYRKYRVTVVDAVPYPYHLAISDHWLVHYWRAQATMREAAWMRAEEERFLREPAGVFPRWLQTFGEVAAAVGLDYFSVDCALTPTGDVLVFECDATAFVHCREALDDVFVYKYDAVPRIFGALDELLTARSLASRAG